jgi:hypothetical protein
VKHHYVRQIFRKICVFKVSKFWSFKFDVATSSLMFFFKNDINLYFASCSSYVGNGLTLCYPCVSRIGQVIPFYKTSSIPVPRSYRPISLTSIFRNTLEKHIRSHLVTSDLPSDITQVGFVNPEGSLNRYFA